MIGEHTRFTVLGLNPNDVAAFLAVAILSLPVLLKWSRHSKWLVWPLEITLIALLVGTGSRGGVLALLFALSVALYFSWCSQSLPRNRNTWIGILLAVLIGTGLGLEAFPKGFRLGNFDVSPEASAGRRLEVWSTVPLMLASAPSGWGMGNSANSYEQWFEPLGQTVELKHLLSSHLTWLVELGWSLRWLYLFVWMAAFTLLTPSRKFVFVSGGVAVWTAFLIALFYNAAGKWWNWPIPILWIIVALFIRLKQRSFPSRSCWIRSALLAGALVATPFVIPTFHRTAPCIQGLDEGNIVLIGSGSPAIAILGPSRNVLGDFYGQIIRREWSRLGQKTCSVIIINRPDTTAIKYLADCRLCVLSEADNASVSEWRRCFSSRSDATLVLINCRAQPNDWTNAFGRILYYQGQFYANQYYLSWRELSAMNTRVSIKDLPGQETYVADWWPLSTGGLVR